MDTSRDLGKVAMIIREECTAPFKATHDDGESLFGMRSNIVDDELSPPSKFVGDISHIQEKFVDDMKQHFSQCKDDLVLKLEDYRSLDNELLAETNCCVQPRCVTPDVDHVSSGDDDNTKGFSMNEIITSVQGFCEQRAPSECLFSLPVDALHCIASFVTASDWASFGCVSTVATSICRAVFRRVRMHGFHCATEVINAWKLCQHADARELAALYISSGVPIYPLSLGHSYHTLVWRMGIEIRELEHNGPDRDAEGSRVNSTEGSDMQLNGIDGFFAERYESRPIGSENMSDPSYLEEKCLFWYNKAAETDPRLMAARVSMNSRVQFSLPNLGPGSPVQGTEWDGRTRWPDFRPGDTNAERSLTRHTSQTPQPLTFTDASRIPPKVKVKIHSHLVDQYMLGRGAIDDVNGTMVASPVCLAADFFHPALVAKRAFPWSGDERDNVLSLDEIATEFSNPFDSTSPPSLPPVPSDFSLACRLNCQMTDRTAHAEHQTNDDSILDSLPEPRNPRESELISQTTSQEPGFGSPLQLIPRDVLSTAPPPPPVPTPVDLIPDDFTAESKPPFLSNIEIEVYNTASGRIPSLSDRFVFYQRRLESLFACNDSVGFDECMLDLWDEFFPTSKNIHFYDQNTAVPRVSGLRQFLTQPCPKALGIVQCEIERIKINSKRKGVNVKGRLFPTYEYRLFIRDRRHDLRASETASGSEEDRPLRRDTVLMMAKNRGRKHKEFSSPGSSKKGVNNYYLYHPEQVDVDAHFRSVNNNFDAERMSNGASSVLLSKAGDIKSPVLLGRLQSNFIGTEFQIFTPSLQKDPGSSLKPCTRSLNALSSDSESDYEASSDSAYSSRRNRFQRSKSGRGRYQHGRSELGSEPNVPHPISEEESVGSPSSLVSRKHKRAYSLPNFSYRMSRYSRRAVAHSVDSPINSASRTPPVSCEDEDGAITYTANLLGNRPRIMDVCVPKVSGNGVAGSDWKKYLKSIESTSDSAPNSMLNHFKQLQQRLDNADQNFNNNNDDDSENEADDFGLLALQNRPPWWNVELGAFVLNFGGRVSVASVKNFQLCDRTDHDYVMLQFGRIQGRHSFTMDFQHPLTAVQAFAIAISSLQSKLSFG